MKIIDLLNKIANKEEVPEKIIYLCDIYELHTINEFTYYKNGTTPLLISTNSLNDEVEIIEEPKKIKKLNTNIINAPRYDYERNKEMTISNIAVDFLSIAETINEIIDHLNKED